MPAYINIIDTASGNVAAVNSDKEIPVALTNDPDKSGYVKIVSVDGIPYEATQDGHILVSEDTVTFFDQVDGSAINTNLWDASQVSGMTITQSGGFINLNAGAATTANAYAILKSIKTIPLYPEFPVFCAIDLKVNVAPQANLTIELGFGNPTGTSAITDGVFYRFAVDGTLKGVTVNSGSETTTATQPNVTVNIMNDFDITVEVDNAAFEINDDAIVQVPHPPGLPFATGTTRLPLFVRVYNGSSAPGTAPQVSIGRVSVVQKVLRPNKPWGELLSSLGRGAYQSPVTTFAQTAQHANSTTPSAATLSNTAAGYTTLGGRFLFNVVSSAATDYALFGYQVPAGYQCVITGISISAAVSVALGLTATLAKWSLGVNSSAVSLATVDGAGTWAPRRIPLGIMGFPLSSIVGTQGSPINITFPTPITVDGGRFVHVILQTPVSSATGTLNGDVMINAYFE